MTRRCSHCGNNGHNSRTCPNRVVRLFGVRLTDGSIRKSASMGNLSHVAGPGDPPEPYVDGYASDDCLPGMHSRERKKASPGNGPEAGGSANGCSLEDCAQGSRERKKGVPWTEEEHKMFLLGLKQLGKGDWRGIARGFVITRTPTQVASHAQKYFIRQTNGNRRKRRASLFDMPDEPGDAPPLPLPDQEQETQSKNPPPAPLAPDAESTSMTPILNEEVAAIPRPEMLQCPYPMMYPAYMPPPFYPYAYPVPVWPVLGAATTEQAHEIVRPTAVHSRAPANVEEINVMSALSLQEPTGQRSPALPPRYLGVSERHSAFHANPPTSSPRSSPIHAV